MEARGSISADILRSLEIDPLHARTDQFTCGILNARRNDPSAVG
jgi:hypothetical protein